MSILSEPHFHSEDAAFERLEAIVWPNGPVCPKCGNCELARFTKHKGATARPGLRTCLECKKQFTVKVGTVFEFSHIPLHKWFQAAHLMASGKKGISARQLHRTLQVTYKTAWFMAHRLRDAIATGDPNTFGSDGGVVEVDETFIGIDTNTIEGYFGIFKRGTKGGYQHCATKRLHRYVAASDFCHNNRVALGIGNTERSAKALAGIDGRRLKYQDSSAASL